MLLQIIDISSKWSDQAKIFHNQYEKIIDLSSKLSTYEDRFYKVSINNIIKFQIARKENENLLKNNIDKFKAEASRSIDMKASYINSYKSPSSYD